MREKPDSCMYTLRDYCLPFKEIILVHWSSQYSVRSIGRNFCQQDTMHVEEISTLSAPQHLVHAIWIDSLTFVLFHQPAEGPHGCSYLQPSGVHLLLDVHRCTSTTQMRQIGGTLRLSRIAILEMIVGDFSSNLKVFRETTPAWPVCRRSVFASTTISHSNAVQYISTVLTHQIAFKLSSKKKQQFTKRAEVK